MKLVIFGGGGHVARHVARLAKGKHEVISVIRSDSHPADLKAFGATPTILSLETATVREIAELLQTSRADAVLFAAGAGGKGDPSRTRLVDYDGAVNVYNACADAGVKRLILISAIDTRDRSKPAPEWYNKESKERSDKVWAAIGRYMQAKYDSEVALHNTSLDFTVLRPGTLTHEPAGGAEVGRTQMGNTSRELVAKAVLACLDTPGTGGLTLDVMDGGGDVIQEVVRCANHKIDAWTG